MKINNIRKNKDTRICTRCKNELPIDRFGTYKAKGLDKRYYHSLCKSCRNRMKQLKKYDLSYIQYQQLFDNQEGKCCICKRDDLPLVVDHCHKTGKVRGLLCTSCNTGLGHFRENIEVMKEVIKYIKKYN